MSTSIVEKMFRKDPDRFLNGVKERLKKRIGGLVHPDISNDGEDDRGYDFDALGERRTRLLSGLFESALECVKGFELFKYATDPDGEEYKLHLFSEWLLTEEQARQMIDEILEELNISRERIEEILANPSWAM